MSSHTLHHGDCLAVLRSMEADSVDAVVTDPPAGIAFMGKEWDKDKGGRDAWVKWMTEVARECLRVIKPGGHALVWAIPRTSHWTGWAWEDAGWEPRDKIVHLFGSGFPKSLNVSIAIDKAAGAMSHRGVRASFAGNRLQGGEDIPNAQSMPAHEAITDAARQWQGWGTALKPAAEDWWLFRKPLDGTVAANVIAHGTGALNIDATRIGTDSTRRVSNAGTNGAEWRIGTHANLNGSDSGRWPANVALGCACDGDSHGADCVVSELDRQSPISGTPKSYSEQVRPSDEGGMFNLGVRRGGGQKGDVGGASRFFYTAKASRRERGEGNTHPTVKPLALMRWLVKLVCPPDGTVLDPFSGSGTTLLAAKAEGFNAIGIEREAEYVEIIKRRLAAMTPEWLREIESEMNSEPEAPDESPTPASIDDLLGFGDE